jgi:HEPN domain-containing protein
MKPLTAEWLAKAAEDISVAAGIMRRKKVPANSVCFHCQQAAEKYLKGLLQENGEAFGKTHDLEELLRQASVPAPSLGLLANDCKLLGDYAVRYRYPGVDATRRQAREAVVAAKRIRLAVLAMIR